MITDVIIKAFETAKQRGWDRIYISIDIHDTMIKANYKTNSIPTEFYPYAIEVLQKLTKRSDIKLILYTCSHPHEIEQYTELFKSHDIVFDYVNENPEVKTDLNGYGNYEKKPYFNVLMDDKAGFNPNTEWRTINMIIDHFTLNSIE